MRSCFGCIPAGGVITELDLMRTCVGLVWIWDPNGFTLGMRLMFKNFDLTCSFSHFWCVGRVPNIFIQSIHYNKGSCLICVDLRKATYAK